MARANDFNDLVAFPPYTTKQELLRDLLDQGADMPNLEAVLYRINNSDTDFADSATVYDPADSFASAVV